MPHLTLTLLGGFAAALNAAPLTAFGTDKARALLAWLALEPERPHARAELAGQLWPHLPEKKAAHNLSQTLLRLRQALREPKASTPNSFLHITLKTVQFNAYSNHQLDVGRFQELVALCRHHAHPEAARCETCAQWLRQAIELYQGPLLAGFFVPDSVAFEEWRLIQQEHLHQQALEALTQLALYHELRGEVETAQTYVRRQLLLEPWHEAAHLQMMRLLAQGGQPGAALRQYETYRETLAQELGLRPAAAATALYEQIRAGAILTPTAPTPPPEAHWLPDPGELRQVTTLVCSRGDIYTPAAPEASLTFCEQFCRPHINRFGGQRTARQGLTCLVYFGYPEAYEDAAQRAVYAALAMTHTTNTTNAARIGIHTGLVMVGERRGPHWQDRDLIGHAIELARDCHRQAAPGQVVLTEATRQLVQATFDLAPLPMQGTPPLPTYYVQGENTTAGRLAWQAQTQRLTPLTGRQTELGQLKIYLARALQGQGQSVWLSGEPGIGKSRLVWELKESLAATKIPTSWFISHCAPHTQNTALQPFLQLLEQFLGFTAADTAATRQAKLQDRLAQHDLDHPMNRWLLALWLGLPTDRPAPAALTRAQRDQMRQLFVTLVQKHAVLQPVVLVIEDLHWSDPSTVEWLEQSLTALATKPCLTLFTARPNFSPTWLAQPTPPAYLHHLPLTALDATYAQTMVATLANAAALSSALQHHIVTQTGGNPLFIEELTKTLLAHPTLPQLTTIPTTLQDSLTARLDQLGAAKETAQWAAVAGREFSALLLQACVPYPVARLQTDINRLVAAALIIPTTPDHYIFRHGLIQEATYASLLKSTQQAQHQQLAQALETRFPQVVAVHPELLAEHYTQGGLPNAAVAYWLRAGQRALAQGASREAAVFFEQALVLIPPTGYPQRWQALLGKEAVLDWHGERASQMEVLAELIDLAQTLQDDACLAEVYLRQTACWAKQGEYQKALPPTEAAIAAAQRANNLALELQGWVYKAQTLIYLREMEVVRHIVEEHLAQALQLTDVALQARVFMAMAHYYLEIGDLAPAVEWQLQSITAAQQSADLPLTLSIKLNLAVIYPMLGLYAEAQTILEEGVVQAETIGERRLHAAALRHLGLICWRRQDLTRALALEQQALVVANTINDGYGAAACHNFLGSIYADLNEWALAAEHLQQAQAEFAANGATADEAETLALAAKVALARGHTGEAQQYAQRVWDYLAAHGLETTNLPTLTYLALAQVAAVVPMQGFTTQTVIDIGYFWLMETARKISKPAWREALLTQIPENRALVAWWQQLQAAQTTTNA